MKNTKIFLGVAFISAIFMQSALGEYVRKTAPNADEDQPKFTPRPTKPLPIPQKKQVPQTASPTASQQHPRLDTPTQTVHKPLPTPPQTVRKPLPIAPNPFDTPMTEKEREAAAKDTDNPFANVLRPATAEIAKKENAAETVTTTQWQRATPVGIEEKRKADEQAAKSAEQAAKIKEVADRLQPKQPTIWEKIKQGATTFLGRKPAVEISAPTDFRHLSTEEAAAKAQADINAAKAQAANTAAQVKERTAIQKLGTKIIDQINIFTAKISGPRAPSAKEAASIKGAINGFVDSVRNKFATATQPMRKTISAQLDSITRNLNQAIAKIPVNSPQRRQMLSSKFALNHLALNTAKANLDAAKTTAEKLAAAAEYSRALEKMLSSPESRRIGLAEIEAAIKKNNDILSRSPDATTETNVARVTKALQQQRDSILAVEATKKEHAALTREFVEGAKKEAAALAVQEKELADQLRQIKAELSTARDFVEGAGGSDKATQQRLKDNAAALDVKLDEASKKLAAHQAKQAELTASIKQAEDALKTPATRLKEAQEAIKKSNKTIDSTAKTFKASLQSAFKNLEKTIAGAPKKVQAAATKLNRDLSAKVSKIGTSMGKALDTAINDFDTFIKKPLVKELSSANKEIQKGINRIITEARKFINITKTQNEQRKAAEDARKKAEEETDYVRQSQETAKKVAAEKEASIKAAELILGVKRSATSAEIAKAFRLAAIKANKTQDPIARQTAIAEITKAKGVLVNKQAELYSGAGSATGTESEAERQRPQDEATPTQSTRKQGDVD